MPGEVAASETSSADEPQQAPPVQPNWWCARRFHTDPDPAEQAEGWIAQVLPEEGPVRDTVAWIADELAANAIMHTRSGASNGAYTAEIGWVDGVVRVVIGDQGAEGDGPVIQDADETGWHGLHEISRLADALGVTGTPDRRWVYADVAWQQNKPPSRPDSARDDSALRELADEQFPGSAAWWAPGSVWRAVPGFSKGAALIEAPSPGAVLAELAAQYAARQAPPAGPLLSAPVQARPSASFVPHTSAA